MIIPSAVSADVRSEKRQSRLFVAEYHRDTRRESVMLCYSKEGLERAALESSCTRLENLKKHRMLVLLAVSARQYAVLAILRRSHNPVSIYSYLCSRIFFFPSLSLSLSLSSSLFLSLLPIISSHSRDTAIRFARPFIISGHILIPTFIGDINAFN